MVINSEILNTIERIKFCNVNEPSYFKSIELGNPTTKEEIISKLTECESFVIGDGYISFLVKKTQEEINDEIDRQQRFKNHFLFRLAKWSIDEKYRRQIFDYLQANYPDMLCELTQVKYLQTKHPLILTELNKRIQ